MTRRTCTELGVCQARTDCTGCASAVQQHDTRTLSPGEFFFAPGTIVYTRRRLGLRTRALKAIGLHLPAVLQWAAVVALAASISFSAGWLSTWGWPL